MPSTFGPKPWILPATLIMPFILNIPTPLITFSSTLMLPTQGMNLLILLFILDYFYSFCNNLFLVVEASQFPCMWFLSQCTMMPNNQNFLVLASIKSVCLIFLSFLLLFFLFFLLYFFFIFSLQWKTSITTRLIMDNANYTRF